MADIRERLQRQPWDPTPGDELIGTIVAITERESKFGWYPVFTVADDETGKEFVVSGSRGGILDDVLSARPKVGDRIGLKFDGPQPRITGSGTWDKMTVAFDNDGATEPDWDRMAKSRSEARKPRAEEDDEAQVPAF